MSKDFFLSYRRMVASAAPCMFLLLLVFTPKAFAETKESSSVDVTCQRYDQKILEGLKRYRDDPEQVEALVSVIQSYGNQCSFEKSLNYCATLGNKSCRYVIELRNQSGN